MYLTTLRRVDGAPHALTLLVLSLSVLVAQVDTAVVNLGVRPIASALAAPVGEMQWLIDAYNLAYAVVLLTGGLLADLHGRRRIFMIGAALFTLASLACTFAPSVAVLIAGRAVAGVGAALMIPASLAILRVVWLDPGERARALGVWAACYGLAMAVGPTLGGVLITAFGWRSIFLMVVPLSLGALLLARPVIPESADPEGRAFDFPAQLAGAVALGGVAFAAIEAHVAPVGAVAALLVAALAFAAFGRIEARQGAAALVPLDLLRIPPFRGAAAATGGMTFGMYGVLFVLPLFWQASGRLGPVGVGVAMVPLALAFLVVSLGSGHFAGRLGTRFMTGGGVGIIAAGVLIIGFGAGALAPAVIGLALTGLGMGLATGPLTGVAVGAVGPALSGTASSLINVVRMAGATLGVAAMGTVFAAAGGGTAGLVLAMLVGGTVQLAGALTAWRTIDGEAVGHRGAGRVSPRSPR
jgi:EmrB/QacA subfamily drug resistance transporter